MTSYVTLKAQLHMNEKIKKKNPIIGVNWTSRIVWGVNLGRDKVDYLGLIFIFCTEVHFLIIFYSK
jgi:hypothetical protein